MGNDMVNLSLKELESLIINALVNSGTSESNARPLVNALVAAEAEDNRGNGIARLPTFCEHVRCGKVDGKAEPSCTQIADAALRVDARDGFAQPAIDLGFKSLVPLARKAGIAAMAVTNSYNCGVVGYYVEGLAAEGLVSLAFVNAPASMAPWGGSRALFGTNPIAFAAPRKGAYPLVIDQSSSVVARGAVIVAAQRGEAIPEGWALDKNGNNTTDPNEALSGGTMVPLGGYKGACIALMVEIMSAILTGATPSAEASSFANNEGGPPRTGQFFVAFEPQGFSGSNYMDQIEALVSKILGQKGTRLPGDRRIRARERTAKEGVNLERSLYQEILSLCGNKSLPKGFA
jgi:(2R)-3-sulfolactate dehydrogenase (NADP+)